MKRFAFRRGLALGVLGGAAIAAVRAIQGRRPTPAAAPATEWPPLTSVPEPAVDVVVSPGPDPQPDRVADAEPDPGLAEAEMAEAEGESEMAEVEADDVADVSEVAEAAERAEALAPADAGTAEAEGESGMAVAEGDEVADIAEVTEVAEVAESTDAAEGKDAGEPAPEPETPPAPAMDGPGPVAVNVPAPEAEIDSPATDKAPPEESPTWIAPVDGSCPASHPVKAKLVSKIFHLPGMLNYERTAPDRCYIDATAAEEDGLRPAKR